MSYTIHCATCTADIGPIATWDEAATLLDAEHAHHSYSAAPTE